MPRGVYSCRMRPTAAYSLLVGVVLSLSGCATDDSVAAGMSSGGSAGATMDAGAPIGPPVGNEFNDELPGLRCPGDDRCAPSEDLTLHAGVAVRDITPDVDHVIAHAVGGSDVIFEPGIGDKCVALGSCDPTQPDTCDAVDPVNCWWIAGTSLGRGITEVAGPTEVGCAVLSQGETAVALCAVDAILWLYEEVERTRELLRAQHPEVEVDLVVVSATHDHQTQDTVGFFGRNVNETGLKLEYNERIRQQTVDAIASAWSTRQPVSTQFGSIRVDGSLEGTDRAGHRAAAFVSDTRDPVVIDDELRTIRFVATSDGATVATLINWTAHAEYAGLGNTRLHADYPGALRDAVEGGILERGGSGEVLFEASGVGGEAIFFPGALGGQVGPGVVRRTGFDGVENPGGSIENAETQGKLLAAYALRSLEAGARTVEVARLGIRAQEIFVEAQNLQLLFGAELGLFDVTGFHYDPALPIAAGNFPLLKAQVAVVDLGLAQLVTVPGEPHAELMLATRDGLTAVDPPYLFTPEPFQVLNHPSVHPDCETDGYSRCQPEVTDITIMDRDRVMDLSRHSDVEHRWVVSLALGYAGYIVPEYDFLLDESLPYFVEAPGRHYEETVTFGPTVEREVFDPLRQLLESRPVVPRSLP